MLVWDNLNTHVSAAMEEVIAARPWLTVFRLPPYAHELNPVEPVWAHLKRSLANLTKHDITELTAFADRGDGLQVVERRLTEVRSIRASATVGDQVHTELALGRLH